jgi:preprotein translocase subunit YajC
MPQVEFLSFAQSAGTGAGNMLNTLLMFGAMFAILYFILIRPQQKQQKKHQALLAGLKKGDEVVLSSGIMGKIFAIEDRVVFIEIGEKTRLKVLKQAVSGLVNQPEIVAAAPKDQGPTT